MFCFEIEGYRLEDMKALRRAMGRKAPVRRAVSWGLRLALGAVGLLFALTVVFFWGTFFGSGPEAALRPGSNDLAVAVICHAVCFLALVPALGYGRSDLRRLLRIQEGLTPLTVTLDGEGIVLGLPRWADAFPYRSVESVFRAQACWILFLKDRRALVLPERCLVRGGAYPLESFFEGRTGNVTCLGGVRDGF